MGRHRKRYRALKTVTPSPNHGSTNVASLPSNGAECDLIDSFDAHGDQRIRWLLQMRSCNLLNERYR